MSGQEWCDFNDMPASGCAHCQGTPELDVKEKPELDQIIVAKHDGKCSVCGDPIVAGEDHIGRVVGSEQEVRSYDGTLIRSFSEWAHFGCGR